MSVASQLPLIDVDPWLAPYADALNRRREHYEKVLGKINQAGGLLGDISRGHFYFGFNRGTHDGKTGVWYREWAPAALQLWVIGDFNDWNRFTEPLSRDQFGVWSIFLADEKYGQ